MDTRELRLLQEALETLAGGFSHLPDSSGDPPPAQLRDLLEQIAGRLAHDPPFHHPLYAGQMMKPPHPAARLAYALSLWLNPNNHSVEGGCASTQFEKEAVGRLAAMFGWRTHVGHLCSGGTIANLEALWVAIGLYPEKTVVASEQAHYTHRRACEMMRTGFQALAVDARGRLQIDALAEALENSSVGTVVVTLGTTGLGALDPLPAILELRREHGFRIHVDAAYGGYFTLVDQLPSQTRAVYDALSEVDSIVIDPHKHGLQPYGCGCVLFRDPGVTGRYRHQAPYAYYTPKAEHLGAISLECSRPGAAAVALWATQKLLPLSRDGAFARGLDASLRAAHSLYRRLCSDERFLVLAEPELDIVVWAPADGPASAVSALSRGVHREAAGENLHLALVDLPAALLRRHWPGMHFDTPTVTCLRSCLMKPEHLDWLDRIWRIIDKATDSILYNEAVRIAAQPVRNVQHAGGMPDGQADPGR